MIANGSLIPELVALNPALIIFDKDGTLIDINAMWGGWVTELARRLEAATGRPITEPLFETLAFDPVTGIINPTGPLSVAPLVEQQQLTRGILRDAGLSSAEVEAALAVAWYIPDPVALAHPLADLSLLFNTLRARGLKITIATSDDRAPTQATLAGLELAHLVDALVCADDGIPLKPAPDMILTICRTLDIAPASAVMVGDNPDDLRMGRAAGVGLVVGVLCGVSPAALLTPHADIILPSVAGLVRQKENGARPASDFYRFSMP